MDRIGIRRWKFQGAVNVELTISEGRIHITDVKFDAAPEPVVDDEFARCYVKAVKRFEFLCDACRPGRLHFPWQFLTRVFGEGGFGFTDADWLDPRYDRQFVIRCEATR
jgi:hypothetical protein